MSYGGRILAGLIGVCLGAGLMTVQAKDKVVVKLPLPRFESKTSVEQALRMRRSIRDFAWAPLTLGEIGQLAWAAQGITQWTGRLRAAPSAGALYPLELYIIVGNADDLERGTYHYIPLNHELVKIDDRDVRAELSHAALDQESVRDAPVVLLFTGIVDRTKSKYGGRSVRYIYMEAGHAAQNVYLQSVSLGLGTVVVGAFNDEEVGKVMNLPEGENPLYLMPIGKPGVGNP